ncbi:adenosine kinase [Spirochaetia bacterium]|nr:adenosine kinase [Spirochaetia bacterium]
MAKTELLCIGNAIVDVFTRVDSAFLERFGITQPVQHIDRDQAELILGELGGAAGAGGGRPGSAVFCSGGGAANVAKIAAMLGIGASFAGCVGQDSLAAIFEKDLTDAGAAVLLSRGTEKTGVCFILDNRGAETRIAASPGAALEFTDADVSEELIAGVDVVVLDGYALNRRPLTQRILQVANCRGIPVALDVASVFQVRERAEEILHYSRNYPLLIFMNADEAIAFFNTIKKTGGENNISEREKELMILEDVCPMFKIITSGEIFPIITIKLGSRGALVIAGGMVYREETFTTRPHSSVGAGDAFCAAFLSAWIRGRSLSECAALGNKVAREILGTPGTMIKADKLKSFAKMLR